MRLRFDWFLMVLFLANMVMSIFNENYTESMAWACAALTLGRVLLSSD